MLFSLSMAVADAGFASAAQRSFFDYTESDVGERRRVIFTAFTSTMSVATAVAVVLVLGRHGLADALFGRAGKTELVVLVAASVPLVNAANFLRETMRLRFRAWHYVVSSVTAAAVSPPSPWPPCVASGRGSEAIFFGMIVGNASRRSLRSARRPFGHRAHVLAAGAAEDARVRPAARADRARALGARVRSTGSC